LKECDLVESDSSATSWRGSIKGHYLVIYYCVIPIVVGSLLYGLKEPQGIRYGFGTAFFVIGAVSLLSIPPMYFQRLSCSSTELHYPKTFFRRGTMRIQDISGVGLVWSWRRQDRAHIYGKGWVLTIWMHGNAVPFAFPQFLDQAKIHDYHYAKSRKPRLDLSSLPSEQVQWGEISESRTALVARDIYSLVSAYQGSTGYLSAEAMQLVQSMETPKRRRLVVHAIWSPDGHFRRADAERLSALDQD
jgi:hypothetical protein